MKNSDCLAHNIPRGKTKVFIDPDFPILLGQELYRPDAKYILKYVTRPRVKHEFFKGPGDVVQLD